MINNNQDLLNNKQNIIVGVDGGGSSCKMMIKDNNGNVLSVVSQAGIANVATNPEETWNNVRTLYYTAAANIKETYQIDILDKNKYSVNIGLGLAGYGMSAQVEKFAALLIESQLFDSHHIRGDVFVAYLGAYKGGAGSVIICGTGSSAFRYNDSQEIVARGGGTGFPHNISGSMETMGLSFAQFVLKRCGAVLCRQNVEVNLEEALLSSGVAADHLILAFLQNTKYYNFDNTNTQFAKIYTRFAGLEFMQVLNTGDRSGAKYAKIAGFIKDILDDAKTCDVAAQVTIDERSSAYQAEMLETARGFVKTMAQELEDGAYQFIKADGVPVVLFGGASELVKDYLSAELRSNLLTFADDEHIALQGACDMIARTLVVNQYSETADVAATVGNVLPQSLTFFADSGATHTPENQAEEQKSVTFCLT